MKNKVLLPSAVLFTAALFFAQEQQNNNIKESMISKTISFDNLANAPAFVLGKMIFDKDQNLTSKNPELKLLSSEKDETGMSHYRYQQTLNSYPIEGATLVQHVKQNKVLYQNGEIVTKFGEKISSNQAPKITEKEALSAAKEFIGAKVYKWEDPLEEEFIKKETNNPNATFKPTGTLVYYSPGAEFNPNNLRLTYKFDIYAAQPLSRKIVYVDALTGEILGSEDKIKHFCNSPLHKDIHSSEHNTPNHYVKPQLSSAQGTAVTAYSGSKQIATDYYNGTYRLRDTTRGQGIETYNLKRGTSYYSAVDFTDSDNYWNNTNYNLDQYATDVHWGSEMVYDFYKNTLNRNGIDNQNMKMLSYVHYSKNYVNAFWDGSRMTYGDGNSSYNPLVSLDIVGHEMTHGVTERSSSLAYRGESGALNEAYSDIMGAAVDFWARPNQANWTMGEEIGAAFRSMSNPNAYYQPDTYKGSKWVNTENCYPSRSNDNCGVHTNSGVLNYWFYLLVNGGSGTNDIGNYFTVNGIGISKATAIAYRTNVYYLTSSSNYADARNYSIRAAKDLYGDNSNEVKQVKNAFYAVGIGSAAEEDSNPTPQECLVPSELTATNITSSKASLSWNPISNADKYILEYKPSSDYYYTSRNVYSNTVDLTGLDSNTTYKWRVKTKCTNNESDYANSQFKTLSSSNNGCNGAFEPNNSISYATSITNLNTDYSASIENNYDLDYYKVKFSSSGSLTIKLSGLTHDVDLALYNDSGYRVASSQKSGTSDEKIHYYASSGTYYIKVYPYSGSNPNACYQLRLEAGYTIAGNNLNENNDVNSDYKIYPNPATDFINISVPEKLVNNTNVQIYDMNGKIVSSLKLSTNNQKVSITHLPQGLYTAKIDTGDGETSVIKFIKK